MDRLKLLLRDKYSLVHVPNRHKVTKWLALTRSHLKTGQAAEQAGLLAARMVFPYEVREHAIYASAPVEELLRHADPDGNE